MDLPGASSCYFFGNQMWLLELCDSFTRFLVAQFLLSYEILRIMVIIRYDECGTFNRVKTLIVIKTK